MPVIRSRGWVNAPVAEVFAFFDDPANLGRIMPPPAAIRLARVDPQPAGQPADAGSILEFRYGLGPWRPLVWVVRIEERVPGERFRDSTLSGPVARFEHTHRFRASRSGRGTWVEDEIRFHVGPGGAFGGALDAVAGLVMRLTFTWRHARTRWLLERAG
jgi:ligand-binding SRPBCC domain-containing protein